MKFWRNERETAGWGLKLMMWQYRKGIETEGMWVNLMISNASMCKFVFIKYFSVVCNFMHSRKCYVDKVLSRHSPSLQERYKHAYFHKRCALGPLMYKNRYQSKLIINSYFFKILKMIHYKYMRCVYTQTREVWIMQNYFILW